MSKTDLSVLPKAQQRIARSWSSGRLRKAREQVKTEQAIGTGLGLGASVAAAVIDHKFRKGAEAEARLGNPDATFRPQINALIGTGLLLAGVFGIGGKYSGQVVQTGVGFASPALYTFTRNKLA